MACCVVRTQSYPQLSGWCWRRLVLPHLQEPVHASTFSPGATVDAECCDEKSQMQHHDIAMHSTFLIMMTLPFSNRNDWRAYRTPYCSQQSSRTHSASCSIRAPFVHHRRATVANLRIGMDSLTDLIGKVPLSYSQVVHARVISIFKWPLTTFLGNLAQDAPINNAIPNHQKHDTESGRADEAEKHIGNLWWRCESNWYIIWFHN